MAFQIIRHAFRMIFGNLGQALRCSIGPYVILILGVRLAFAIFGGPISSCLRNTAVCYPPSPGGRSGPMPVARSFMVF